MRRASLSAAASCLAILAAPALASAAGPVVEGGVVRTLLVGPKNERFSNLDGGTVKVGFEVGSRHWRSEWAFNQTLLWGSAEVAGGASGEHRLSMTGFSYQLTFLFWASGLTPYLGAGAEMGLATMEEPSWSSADAVDTSAGAYLRPYGVAGLRLQLDSGLGLRAELSASYYRELVSMGPSLGLSYTW